MGDLTAYDSASFAVRSPCFAFELVDSLDHRCNPRFERPRGLDLGDRVVDPLVLALVFGCLLGCFKIADRAAATEFTQSLGRAQFDLKLGVGQQLPQQCFHMFAEWLQRTERLG